jgi:hypothetical protein
MPNWTETLKYGCVWRLGFGFFFIFIFIFILGVGIELKKKPAWLQGTVGGPSWELGKYHRIII